MKKVTLDYDKLIFELQRKGKTRQWLSRELDKNDSYISSLKSDPSVTEHMERLICLVMEVDRGTFVKVADPEEMSRNMEKALAEQGKAIGRIIEMLESVYQKLNTNTLQLERIRDIVSRTGGPSATEFLRNILSVGRVNANEIYAASDDQGFQRRS